MSLLDIDSQSYPSQGQRANLTHVCLASTPYGFGIQPLRQKYRKDVGSRRTSSLIQVPGTGEEDAHPRLCAVNSCMLRTPAASETCKRDINLIELVKILKELQRLRTRCALLLIMVAQQN